MSQPNRRHPQVRAPHAVILLALLGFLLGLFGTYWDDAWHTEKGRDTFLAAPHVALYAGISLAGGALGLWALLVARREGLRAVLGHPPLLLALLGVGVALGAAPVDNAWHLAFGRDAVVWSPPHMLGVAGNLAIAAGLYLELSAAPRRGAGSTALVAGAAVLAVAAVPVLEYDTDVPQFDLVFYLPALAAGSAFALGLVRTLSDEQWAATKVALVYTAIMAAIALVLDAGGMPGSIVPLVVLPAAALDLIRRRRLAASLSGAVFAAALFAAYIPYLNWLLSGPFLDLADIGFGLLLAMAAAAAGLGLAALARPGEGSGRRMPGVPAAIALLASLAFAAPALAHDPGQGEEVMTANLVGRSDNGVAQLVVRPDHCPDTVPVRLVARRAGEELESPLRRAGKCELAGTIGLPDRGRWFVYAELEHEDELVETWLPLETDGDIRREESRSVYVPPDTDDTWIKRVAGVLVYLLLLGVLVAIPLIARRQGPLARPLGP